MRRIVCLVVTAVFPPIPTTRFDWCAYEDGTEERQHYGYGPTRQAAVDNFFESLESDRKLSKETRP